MILRGLVLLLVLLASSASPTVPSRSTSEIRVLQLARAQIAVFEARAPQIALSSERLPAPPGPPPAPAAQLGRAFEGALGLHVETVVLVRPPRSLAVAHEQSLRDQRPQIRRLRRHAPTLDPASRES